MVIFVSCSLCLLYAFCSAHGSRCCKMHCALYRRKRPINPVGSPELHPPLFLNSDHIKQPTQWVEPGPFLMSQVTLFTLPNNAQVVAHVMLTIWPNRSQDLFISSTLPKSWGFFSSRIWRYVFGQVQILTVEFTVDLGSGLRWLKATVSCL